MNLPAPSEKPRTLRILLIEGQSEDSVRMQGLFEELPGQLFELTWWSDAREAHSTLRLGGWDACLLGHCPGVEGNLGLLRELMAVELGPPVILLTSHASDELDALAIQLGAADCMAWDELTPRLLARTIRHGIARQHLIRETQRELRERESAETALRCAIAEARCLLWKAEIVDAGKPKLEWQLRFFDSKAAQQFLQLDMSGGVTFSQAWYRSRLAEDRLQVDEFGGGSIRRGENYGQEFRYTNALGEVRWLREDVKVDVVGPGRWRAVGVCTDVTERKRTEEALKESHAILKGVAEGTTDAVFVKNREGRYVMINSAGARFMGRHAEEIIGQRDSEFFSPDTVRAVYASDQAVLESGNTDTFEETLTAAGMTRTFHATKGPLRNPEGEIIGLIGIARDISDRKRAELALRESEARFHAIFDQAAVPMARVSIQGAVLEANFAFQKMLGYTEEELRNRNFVEFTHPDDVGEDLRLFQEMMGGLREGFQLEKRYCRQDGRVVWGHLTVSVVRGEEGQPLFGIGMVEDVSERKALEEQFRQSQRMEAVGQLAGGVAHDFNNMLAVITGYSELMQSGIQPESPLRAYLNEISKAGERAAGLTRQLLAFSRKQLLEARVFDLNATVQGMDKMLGRLIGEDIELVTVADPLLHKIKADPGQIEQVVMNLAINARDAMPVGGLLSICTSNSRVNEAASAHAELAPGAYVSLEIRDTGCGIPPDVLPRIFEPFFTTKEVGKGTGLGLATVYGIVRQSGGSIAVESELGKGTTFTVLLPAVPDETWSSGELEPPLLPRGSETILLTEDDPMVRGMVVTLLTQCGYQVLEASQGEEALRIAEMHEGPIHLLLTDVVMPIMSGRELAQAMRGVRPEAPVLYMSGYTDDAMLRHGVTEAGVELIQKPFPPMLLAQRIRRLLDAAQPRAPLGTVLIVDDDAVERETLGEILQEVGYQVAEAADGQAAFSLLRGGLRPCVILLDLMMPGMNGWVFRLEQRNTPEFADIPVVLISGEFDPGGVEKFLKPAASLPKPLDVPRLLALLAQCGQPVIIPGG